MPFITAAIGAIAGAIGGALSFIGGAIGGLGFFGKALLSIGLNVAVGAIQKAFAPKPKAPPSGVELELQIGSNITRKVMCGLCGSAGHFIYANTYGAGNAFLQQIYVLSDFYTTSLDKVWLDGEHVTLGVEDPIKGRVVTSGDYANLIWVKFYDGWQTSADSGLVDNANPSTRWTENHIGFGTSYVILTLKYDREKLANPPQAFFEFKGAPLYNLRLDDTVGGDGDHRFNDISTWEYSDDPVLIDYCYRRGFSINGDLFCGMSMAASDLPISEYATAANICEEDVGGRVRYRCSIGLDCSAEHGDNIDALMLSCGGMVVHGVDGTFPLIGTDQAIVATLTDDDLIVGEPVDFQRLRAMDELVNSVSGTYPNPENQWSPAGYQRATDTELVTADRRTKDVQINFDTVPDGEQASQLAAIYLSENRFEATATITVRSRWIVLEPGDWIRWISVRYGNRVYMVTDTGLKSLGNDKPRCVTLSLQERDGEIYETVGVTLPPAAIPPGTPVYQQQLVDFAAVGVIGAGANSLVYPMIRVSWSTPSDPTVAEIVVFWRAKDGPGPTFSRVIKVGTNIAVLTEGVVSETEYEVWHQLVADPARATSPTAPIGVTTPYAPSRDVEVTLGQLQTDVYGSLTNIRAILDDLSATVTDLATSSAQGQLSVQSNIQDTMAVLGDAVALVRQETRVLAKADLALAEQITSVSASLGDLLAQGLLSIQAQAGSGEVLARIVIYARASIEDDFEEAGMELQVKSTGGVLSSQVVFNANKFVVTDGSNENLPLVFEGGELKLFVARMGKAIVDETLETSTGKTRFGNFGSPVEGIRVSS